MTKFSKWILFISSYIPLYLIFIVSNSFDIWSRYKEINQYSDYTNYMLINCSEFNLVNLFIFIILSLLSLTLLAIILKKESTSTTYHNLYNIKKNNGKINEYVLVYILPFITVNSSNLKDLIIFLIIYFVIGFLSVKNDIVYVNPILYMAKYNLYSYKEDTNAEEESVLITKYSIIDLKRKGNWDSGNKKIRIMATKLNEGVHFIEKE